MNEKNKTTKDHYVPQFILRGFSNKNKKQYKAYVHDDILYPLKKFTINDLKELKNIEKSKFQGNQSKEYLYQNLQLLKEENEEYKDVAFHTGSVLSLANILDYSEKNHLKSKINKKNQYYQSNVRDIFSHKNFYACNVADENIDIEKNFQTIENDASKIFLKIKNEKTIKNLTEDERCMLSIFIASLDLRNITTKNSIIYISKELEERCNNITKTSNKSRYFKDSKSDQLLFLERCINPELINTIAKSLLNKLWILFSPPDHHQFIISNKPIQKISPINEFCCGYEIPHVEIHIPISKNFAIVMFDRNYIERDIINDSAHININNNILNLIDWKKSNEDRSKELMLHLKNFTPIKSTILLNHFNFHQYYNSQYVISKSLKYLKSTIKSFQKIII